jgi:hypothetical protein
LQKRESVVDLGKRKGNNHQHRVNQFWEKEELQHYIKQTRALLKEKKHRIEKY